MASPDVHLNARIDKAEKDVDEEQKDEHEESKKVDWSDMSAQNLEKTRALRKRYELQQKLKVKQAAAQTEEEKEAEAAKKALEVAEAAAKAVKKIEEEHKPKEEVEDGKKVKIGQKMIVSSQGKMTKEEQMRLQASVGTGKSSKLKAFFNLESETKEITEEDVKLDEVISFSGCKNCEYTVTADCVKIFVEHCENMTLRLQGKIITHTVEVDACEKMNIVSYVKIGTLQIERCSKVNMMISEKELFRGGFLVWAGTTMLRFQVEEVVINCDFELLNKLDQTLSRERSQFKVWLTSQDKLCCDKILRLENGFPTTKREDDEHERRKQEKLDELAKRMGVNIHRKQEDIGGRVKPNEKCPCGSGQKYKKCCLNGTVKLAAQASDAVAKAAAED